MGARNQTRGPAGNQAQPRSYGTGPMKQKQPPSSTHQLSQVLGRPADLRKGEAALDALQELARDLVAHDMALCAVVELLARAALVDAHHGHADGPRRLADAQAQVAVVGVDIAALLEGLDDLDDGLDERVVEVSGLELSEQLSGLLASCAGPCDATCFAGGGYVNVPASCFLSSAPWRCRPSY